MKTSEKFISGKNELLNLIASKASAVTVATTPSGKRDMKFSSAVMIEIQAYLSLLITVYNLDAKNLPQGLQITKLPFFFDSQKLCNFLC